MSSSALLRATFTLVPPPFSFYRLHTKRSGRGNDYAIIAMKIRVNDNGDHLFRRRLGRFAQLRESGDEWGWFDRAKVDDVAVRLYAKPLRVARFLFPPSSLPPVSAGRCLAPRLARFFLVTQKHRALRPFRGSLLSLGAAGREDSSSDCGRVRTMHR